MTAKLVTKEEAYDHADSVNEVYAVRILEAFFSEKAYYDGFSDEVKTQLNEASAKYHGGESAITPR